MKNVIKDKGGKTFVVVACESDSENYKRFNIEHLGNRVGYLNYHFEEGVDVLFIDDFRIDDHAMRPQWFFVNLIFWGFSFPPERWRVSNFQNRGLGSAMIEFLISYGRSKSVKRIEGYVKPPDDKANRDLLNWYKRRGFTAEMGNERTAWIAKVSLSVKY